MQRAKSDEERWRTEKLLSWDPDMRLGVIQQAQQMHAMWALKLQQYNDLFQEALIEALQDFKHKQVKPSNAFTELPDDMIDSVLEKLDEGESDARKMIQGLKDTLKRKQKQLRQYKAELTELEDIRQVTAWDGLEQNLEQVKNRINRRTKELEALEEDYDERKRQFSHHFSPEKRKIWKKLHHSDRTVTPSRAYADLPAELKGRIEAEALELKRADARQAPVFPNGTRISFDMARRTNRETGHEGVVQDYNFGHYRILRDSGNVWIMRPGDDIVNIEMVSASQVATHLPLGSRVMFSNDDRRSLNYALATVDDTNSQEATTERDQEGEIVNFYRGVYTICDNANRVSYLRQNDVSPVPRAPRNVSASETCPLCLDDDAEEIALCENLGGEDENGERRGHGVCAACLPEYMERARDNCLVCRSPYGNTWREAKRKTYLPATFELLAHQLTCLCCFEVTAQHVQQWYDWEEFMDEDRDGHEQTWKSQFLIDKRKIQSALDTADEWDFSEQEKVRSWWLMTKLLHYELMKMNLKDLARYLTQTCGYDVTFNEVRLWRIVKSKDMAAEKSNFVSYFEKLLKRIGRASTPNEKKWVKKWWEVEREEYLSKISSSTFQDHDSSSIAQGLENEFTIMPTFRENFVTYGFSEEEALRIIRNMRRSFRFFPDNDYTVDFEDEEFCLLITQIAVESLSSDMVLWGRFESFVDAYHRSAIAKLSADTVNAPLANVVPSETCPLCLDDDAEEIALCENLGDFVNAEGERQGHGVCNTCLPAYLATGRDNCLICRTPYGERWQAVRQNYLPEPDPWIREMQDHMAQNSDDSDVSLPYDDDSSSSDDDGPAVPFYGSRPTTRIPVFRRNQAPQLFREGFAGAYTQEDNGGFDLIEDRDNVRQFPDPFEIGSSVWASENSIYTELSRHIPDHARLPSNERYIGLGWVVNAWREGSEVDEDESTWWYTIEWDLSWVSATQPVYIRTDHPRAHLQMEQPRSFARDWVREVPSFHIDVEFKVDGFTPAFDVLSGMTRWETIYCRVIRKMPILGNTNQLVALSREDGTFIQYKLVRSVDIFRGCELERFQFKPHVWPDT